jgi:hypothetical protein
MDRVVPTKEPKESIAVTPRRDHLSPSAARAGARQDDGNVSLTCRTFGTPTRFYKWRGRAECYGLEALMPKQRRRPQLPNATPDVAG